MYSPSLRYCGMALNKTILYNSIIPLLGANVCVSVLDAKGMGVMKNGVKLDVDSVDKHQPAGKVLTFNLNKKNEKNYFRILKKIIL